MNNRKFSITMPQQGMTRVMGDAHGDDLQRRERRRRRRFRAPGDNSVKLRFI